MTIANSYSGPDYETDFYAWAKENAELLKHKNYEVMDMANIALEIEGLAKAEGRQAVEYLRTILKNLLKDKYADDDDGSMRWGGDWKHKIEMARLEIKQILKESPLLVHVLEEKLQFAYKLASLRAAASIGIKKAIMPPTCPFTLAECLDDDFMPSKQKTEG